MENIGKSSHNCVLYINSFTFCHVGTFIAVYTVTRLLYRWILHVRWLVVAFTHVIWSLLYNCLIGNNTTIDVIYQWTLYVIYMYYPWVSRTQQWFYILFLLQHCQIANTRGAIKHKSKTLHALYIKMTAIR